MISFILHNDPLASILLSTGRKLRLREVRPHIKLIQKQDLNVYLPPPHYNNNVYLKISLMSLPLCSTTFYQILPDSAPNETNKESNNQLRPSMISMLL